MTKRDYSTAVTAAKKQWKRLADSGQPIRLQKKTSNLFRARERVKTVGLDLSAFNRVFTVDQKRRIALIGGLTTYEDAVAATLPYGLMPAVVPQLKTITVGGALTGVGIESSSWRKGYVHESVRGFDVLTGSGQVVHATPQGSTSDLFYGFANSYGSLGYSLGIEVELIPVKPFVHTRYIKFRQAKSFFAALEAACKSGRHENESVDFIDGAIFDPQTFVLILGTFVKQAPYTSDYSYKIFYKSLLQRDEDYLTAKDYIWRWDTDWFWCSKNLGAQNPLLRRLYGKKRLKSATYSRLMAFENRWHVVGNWNKLRRAQPMETVIQDVDIPIKRATEFWDFYRKTVQIWPLWICPTQNPRPNRHFSLFPTDPSGLYVNFGFWDSRPAHSSDPNYYDKKVEDEVERLHGVKGLYSNSFYERRRFDRIFNGKLYQTLKAKYDPASRFPGMYEKTVERR